MKKITLFLFLTFVFTKGNAQQNPVADFSVNKTSGCAPVTIDFTNNSTNSVSYFWDFGDGNFSTLKNPSHIYFNSGNYSVKLVAVASGGTADTLLLTNLITVNAKPTADFSVSNNVECVNGNAVGFFNNSSGATNFVWDFGDGTTSTQQNPSHVYSSVGTFSIALIVQNSFGCSDIKLRSDYIFISPKPSAEFFVDTTKFCSLNHTFNFRAADTNSYSYQWKFGDGNFSFQKNSSHIFSSAGKYSVSLIVANQNGCVDSLTKSNYITVSEEIIPIFFTNNTTGCTPLDVSFSNNLSPSLTYNWNFGDSSFSSQKSPIHIYNDTGIFDVSLTVTDAFNCSFTHFENNFINTNDVLNAEFSAGSISGCSPLNVNFSDNSNNADSWFWDFDDGNFSSQKNPTHTFSSPGKYSVSLKVNNANGCESEIQKIDFIVVLGSKSDFTANDTAGCLTLSVQFSDSSTDAVQWFWDFGDGSNSSLKNPIHNYDSAGIFTVKLITNDSAGCSDTHVRTNYIHISGPEINYNNTDTVFSCYEISASFNGSSIGQNFWLWNFGDGDSSLLANPSHTFENAGIYSISLTTQTANGCTLTLNNYNVFEISEPDVDFSFSADTCPNYFATFSDSSENAVSWFWNFGDGTFSTQQNPSHNFPHSGFYSVALTITTEHGCSYSTLKNNAIYFINCAGNDDSGGGFGSSDSMPGDSNSVNQNQYQISGCAPFVVSFVNPFEAAVAFHWNFGNGDTSNSENPVHTYFSAGIFSVSLLVQFPNGIYDTLIWNNYVKVNKVVADFSMQLNNFCNAGNILLSNSSVYADFYLWNFGDGGSDTITNPAHSFSLSGNYLVKLIASDSLGCNSVAVKNIYSGAPSPIFSFDKNICIKDSVHFSGNLENYFSYLWNFGDGDFSTDENPVHIYNSAGNFTVFISVFDSTGCSLTYSAPNEITVNNLVADFIIPDTTGCNNLLVNFQNTSQNSDSWLWNFGDGDTSQMQNPSHIYANVGIYSVSLIAEKNGCINEKIIPDAITVFETSANFSFAQNTLCLPIVANFSDSSANAVSWLWNFGDGKTDTAQNPIHIFNEKPTQNISLTIVDSNGCTDSVSIPNIEIFSAEISASVLNGCDSLTVNFMDKSDSAVSWFWNFGDSTFSTSQNPNHLFSDSGSFAVTLIAEAQDGCKDTLVMPDFIHVHRVVADFISPNSLSGCAPLFANFIDKSMNATHWNWTFGDGATSIQKNPIHIFFTSSEYKISLLVSNDFGCVDTTSKNVSVQPNPFADFTADTTRGCSPLQINFHSENKNSDSLFYLWNFGNGETSDFKNPSVIYSDGGLFDVSLSVVNLFGCSDTIAKQNFIFAYDKNPPEQTEILVVTVLSDTSNFIVWKQSRAFDFEKYVLYRKNLQSGKFEEIAAFSDIDVTSFMDENLNTLKNSYCYKLETIDFCGNSKMLDELTEYCTINVIAKADSTKINVKWTPYIGCSVSEYEILRSEKNKNQFEKIAAVSSEILNYDDTTWHCSAQYSYKIKALDLCGNPVSSFSDTSFAKPDVSVFANQKVEIIRSTVIENSYVLSEWKSPESAPEKVTGYKIFRSEGNLKFEYLASVSAAANSYIDNTVNVSKQNYYYKIVPENECKIQSQFSNNASSVLLETEQNEYEIKLKWTEYKHWEKGVENYIIEKLDENGNWQIIKITEGNPREIKDSLVK